MRPAKRAAFQSLVTAVELTVIIQFSHWPVCLRPDRLDRGGAFVVLTAGFQELR